MIAGIATYIFFKLGTWAVGDNTEERKENFKPLSSLWFATFALAPGFFLPLEQELGRALGHRRAIGQGGRPVVAKVARLGLLLGGIVALVIIAISPIITSNYFDDNWVMVAALVVAFVCYAPAHIARGICSGTGRFKPYAIVMGTDGVVRLVVCLILALDRRAGRRRLRVRRRVVADGRHQLRLQPRQPQDRAGSRCVVGRGDPEPRVAAARLDLRRRPAQRRPGAHDHPRRGQTRSPR